MDNDDEKKQTGGGSPPPSGTPTSLPPLAPLRYQELVDHKVGELRDAGISEGVIANRVSSLKRYLTVNGLTLDHPIGLEFGPNFDATLEAYVMTLGSGPSRSNARSIVRKWREWALELHSLRGLPKTFKGALAVLIKKSGARAEDVAKDIGVEVHALYAWLRGTYPHARKLPKIQKLERFLSVSPGTLLNRLPHMRFAAPKNPPRTSYAEKLVALTRKPYQLRFPDWPERVQKQWDKLEEFKTTPFLKPGQKRNKRWRKRDGNRGRSGRSEIKTGKPKDSWCPSAERNKSFFERVFGWMRQPKDHPDPQLRGLGMPVEAVSMPLICVPAICQQYIKFAEARTGCFSGEADSLLSQLIALLHPEKGFLTQHPEFASEPGIAQYLPEGADIAERWKKFCAKCIEELREMARNIRPFLVKGRDPKLPIQDILDIEFPMTVLFDLGDNMEAGLPPESYPTRVVAAARRDLLLVRMLTAAPLRIMMFSIMTYRADNTGHLRQKRDGSWWLKFEAHEFKNQEGVAKGDYEVPLPDDIFPLIEEYLNIHRKNLVGAGECDFVFLRSPQGAFKHRVLGLPMCAALLSEKVVNAVRRYLPGSLGFRPHAWRHIIATDLVRNDPVGGVARAAAALHDTQATILKNYGHLRTQDSFRIWLDVYHLRRKQSRNGDGL